KAKEVLILTFVKIFVSEKRVYYLCPTVQHMDYAREYFQNLNLINDSA
ncbi:5735_t:CDS:1, partial [Dentiscutata heterogama]